MESSRDDAAPIGLFTRIFSQEEEIIIIEEYKKFVETHGDKMRNKWVEFRKMCSVDGKYKPKQIGKKIVGLENKFKKKMNSSPPCDPHQLRLFHLSKSLWGDHPNPKKRSLPLISVDQPSKKPALGWSDLEVEELELYCKTLTLQHRQCEIILQQLKSKDLNTQSSSSKKKQSEEKDMLQPLTDSNNDGDLFKDTTEVDPAWEQERDESEDDKEVNLEEIEPPVDDMIFSKEELNIVEDGESENEAVVLSIDKDKTENQLRDFANSGGMENVLQLQAVNNVKLEDDGTKKSSSKKEKKKMKKKHSKPQVKTPSFGLVIEELDDGDPNGKIVLKGAKVKVHVTAKVKGSEQLFESSIGKNPCIVNLGDERMIDGLRSGIEGMRVGGKRRLVIPPYLGYGDEGYEGVIPPNSWLEYEVQLLDVSVRRSH